MKNVRKRFNDDIKASYIVTSLGVTQKIYADKDFFREIEEAFYRFMHCDWGELSQEDIDDNNLHLHERCYSTLGEYTTKYGTIWIKTEANRMITTILFPIEN